MIDSNFIEISKINKVFMQSHEIWIVIVLCFHVIECDIGDNKIKTKIWFHSLEFRYIRAGFQKNFHSVDQIE